MREWRAKNPERNRETGKRSDTLRRTKTPVAVQTTKRRERQRGWKIRNPEEYRKQSLAKYHRTKKRAIEKLGGRCACCGERRDTMLQIDHIHNDGHKEGKSRRSYELIKRVIREENPFDRYQILCANCNHSKARNLGLCQHYTDRWFAFIDNDYDPYPYPYAKKPSSIPIKLLLPERLTH